MFIKENTFFHKQFRPFKKILSTIVTGWKYFYPINILISFDNLNQLNYEKPTRTF